MKKTFLAMHFIELVFLFSLSCLGQGAQAKAPVPAPNLPPEEIIKRFTTKESELFETWKDYAYQQETKLQVIGPANTISGEYYQLSEFIFSDAGKRIERIIKAPPSTLDRAGISMTQEDRDALIDLQPFALTANELPKYKVVYVTKEKIDDINAYVFDVTPKAVLDEREMKRMKDQKIEGKFFQGRIWVDDIDLQIVKTAGKVVPEFKYRFPRFETYRENIDGKFWFPTYTYGDDTLVFEKGDSYHMRQVIRYKNYRRFSGDVKIKEIFDDVPAAETKDKKPGEVKPDETKKDASTKPAEPSKTTKPEAKETEKKPPQPANQRPIKKP